MCADPAPVPQVPDLRGHDYAPRLVPTADHYVSFSEAALSLGISVKTLQRKYIEGGKIPWYNFDGTKRIKLAELRAYAAKNRMIGTQPAGDNFGQ